MEGITVNMNMTLLGCWTTSGAPAPPGQRYTMRSHHILTSLTTSGAFRLPSNWEWSWSAKFVSQNPQWSKRSTHTHTRRSHPQGQTLCEPSECMKPFKGLLAKKLCTKSDRVRCEMRNNWRVQKIHNTCFCPFHFFMWVMHSNCPWGRFYIKSLVF